MMDKLLFREKEVGYFERQLSEATGVSLLPDVTCLSGPLGVGKTTILAEVRRKASARGIPAASVDFSPDAEVRTGYLKWEQVGRRYSGESGKTVLVKDMMDGFIYAADAPAARVIQPNQSPEEAMGVLADYSQWLKGFLRAPLALTIDHLEEASAETREWLLSRLIPGIYDASRKPVNMYGPESTFVTMADRRPLRGPRMETLPLEPFSREQTKQVAQDLELEEKTLYKTTGGLPLLINYVDGLSTAGVSDPEEQVKNAVERVILPEIQPADIGGLLALSVLSRFDMPMVMAVTEKTRPQARKLLSPLIDSGVVGDHPDGYGYRVVSGLQAPLHQYVRNGKQDLYGRVHEAAADYAARDIREGDHAAIIEALWSRACLGDTPEKLAEQLYEVVRAAVFVLPEHRYTEFREKIAAVLTDESFADTFPVGTIPLLEDVMKSASLPDRQDS